MPERLLQLDDLRTLNNPVNIATIFRRLGYNATAEPLSIESLSLSGTNADAIYDAYLIANQGDGGLQVLLFHLHPDEWSSPSAASTRIKAIATQVGKRDTEFLLLATKDFNQLLLVNPRKSFDDRMNLKSSIRKLLIDRTNPTAYDLDRLEAIACRGQDPKELYKVQCEAFDVEKLTKSFYKGYKQLFDQVQRVVKEFNPNPYFEDSDRLHQFSQRLLGRIMFLYFLQKKEFLAGDHRFLTTQYRLLRPDPEDTEYYSEVLEPLFFETLNTQRPDCQSKWGKIPYLNGGLFDRDYGKGVKDAGGRDTPVTITLPNSLFDPGEPSSILGFFNGYNFTIAENTAGDEDVAVDPEMLGKVFENMLAAEERGQSGTFYTPRGIVQFMCSEVLARYLSDETGMTLEAVQRLIDYDPLSDSDFNQLITPQQARDLKKALSSLKVLDPAVGSGAFPLGMMQVILNVRQAIARREGMKVSRGSLTISQWKRDIIANNLYGVDIKPEALEIAKLRMWLSLVVDIPNIDDVEPLPNLDYKLMCGDSLISTIHGEQLIPDPTKTQQGMLAVTPIQMAISPLLELEKRYFDAHTEERHHLREQILAAEANVFRVAVSDRRNYWLGKQQELETKIKAMKGKVSKAQEQERAEIKTKLAELDKFANEVESGERSLNFFQYHLHFRDVFESKGGFDIVIGNPPYVSALEFKSAHGKDIRNELNKIYESAKGTYDLYVVFFEQGLKLTKPHGTISYITPNKYLSAKYGKFLREYFLKQSNIFLLVDLSSIQVFQEASVYPIITFVEAGKSQLDITTMLPQNQSENDFNIADFKKYIVEKKYLIMLPDNLWGFLLCNKLELLEKIIANSVFLQDLGKINATSTASEADEYTQFITEKYTENCLKIINTGTIDKYQSLWKKSSMKHAKNNFDNPYLPMVYPPVNTRRKEMYNSPKLIFAKMAKSCEAFLDIQGEYASVNTNCFYAPQKGVSLEFIAAFCNSKLFMYIYQNFFDALRMSGGYYPFQAPQLRVIPCRVISLEKQQPLINLVHKVITAKQSNTDTSQLEAEIDNIIYQLYDLTEEEIAIVEKSL